MMTIAMELAIENDAYESIATKFFATRTDQELADFFARPELTEPEQVEFARLGAECGVAGSGATTP